MLNRVKWAQQATYCLILFIWHSRKVKTAVAASRSVELEGQHRKGHEGSFEGDGNVFYHDCSSYTSLCLSILALHTIKGEYFQYVKYISINMTKKVEFHCSTEKLNVHFLFFSGFLCLKSTTLLPSPGKQAIPFPDLVWQAKWTTNCYWPGLNLMLSDIFFFFFFLLT